MLIRLALTTLALGSALLPAQADRVITTDGRDIPVKKARKEGDGFRLIFEHGEIVLKDRSEVQAVEIEGDMSDYVPADDNEREKLEKGYVRYKGRWMSKGSYELEIKKRNEASKERADELAAHADIRDNPWVEETKHFLIKTNTSPELLEYYGALLEAYYKLMDNRLGIKPTPRYRKIKMEVFIYRSMEEFLKISNERGADVSMGVLGYFWAHDNTLNFFHNYEDPAQSTWVALHECTHLLTFLIDQQYNAQIWLNEALADYYGSSEVIVERKGRKLEIEIIPGNLQTGRTLTVQQAIEESKDIKLEDLFFIERNAFQGFQYAHAWSFVYFLHQYEDGKWVKKFNRFFKEIYTRKGVPTEPSGPASFRVRPEDIREHLLKRIDVDDTEQLEKDWKEFVKNIPIESAGARLERGLRSIEWGTDLEGGVEDLTAAIEAGATDPRAFATRGLGYLMSGNLEGARDDYRKAVEAAPLNAAYRFRLAGLLRDHDEALKAYGLAMELDPENDRYSKAYEEHKGDE